MADRIIDISQQGAKISARGELLVISFAPKHKTTRGARRHDPQEPPPSEVTIPLSDIISVIAAHPQIVFTKDAVVGLSAAGAMLVVCDDRYTPSAMMLPLAANTLQTERLGQQVESSLPTRKRLWQQIMRAKILAQATLLNETRGKDYGLTALASKVKSGDTDNIEARAARIYWPALMNDREFIRDRYGDPPNNLLNYGYAVLRSTAARAICGAGLHPSLGIHHHNRYDTFCLASDIMEPFRPLIDRAVIEIIENNEPPETLTPVLKQHILAALTGRLTINSEQRTLFETLERLAASLVAIYAGERKILSLPSL